MSAKVIKIGNASGYWGDDPQALERQVFGGRLDYISMDFLAEVTMSIMQKQRSRDPKLGYARDFLGMLDKVLTKIVADKTCLITNAGGVNPRACAEAILALGKKLGLQLTVAVVDGDDILQKIDDLQGKGVEFANMETNAKFSTIRPRIEAANVYFGAAAVAEALAWKPNIVITGRVTDTGITLAPMIHEFGWKLNDWDKLSAGIIAGHMIECGAQVCGGNFTDWRLVPSFEKIGFPIVEVQADASFVITKHPGTGGLVSTDTVREQLFYEMGDPKAYLTPDVVADFSTIQIKAAGENRVAVSGIKGHEPTPLYKVSMAFRDGFKSQGAIAICGPDAKSKAEVFANSFWERCQGDFTEKSTEYFGWNACHRSLGHVEDGPEIMLRLGAHADSEDKLKIFGKMIPPLILSGPPGVAVLGGVPKPQEVVSYWPALMPKNVIVPHIALFRDGGMVEERNVDSTPIGNFKGIAQEVQTAERATQKFAVAIADHGSSESVPLSTICLGRSGDKGDTANIGVMARSPEAFEFLDKYLTAERVKNWFQELCLGSVVRYRVPNLQGFNFLLNSALGGGGTQTLRADAQGKTLAQALLRQKVKIPANVLASIKK